MIRAPRTVHVWYDDAGHIVAVGQPLGRRHVVPLGRPGLNALVALVDPDEVNDLHCTHRADPVNRSLIPLDR